MVSAVCSCPSSPSEQGARGGAAPRVALGFRHLVASRKPSFAAAVSGTRAAISKVVRVEGNSLVLPAEMPSFG